MKHIYYIKGNLFSLFSQIPLWKINTDIHNGNWKGFTKTFESLSSSLFRVVFIPTFRWLFGTCSLIHHMDSFWSVTRFVTFVRTSTVYGGTRYSSYVWRGFCSWRYIFWYHYYKTNFGTLVRHTGPGSSPRLQGPLVLHTDVSPLRRPSPSSGFLRPVKIMVQELQTGGEGPADGLCIVRPSPCPPSCLSGLRTKVGLVGRTSTTTQLALPREEVSYRALYYSTEEIFTDYPMLGRGPVPHRRGRVPTDYSLWVPLVKTL